MKPEKMDQTRQKKSLHLLPKSKVTYSVRETTQPAKVRFTPEERGCYFDEELKFKYLPSQLYR